MISGRSRYIRSTLLSYSFTTSSCAEADAFQCISLSLSPALYSLSCLISLVSSPLSDGMSSAGSPSYWGKNISGTGTVEGITGIMICISFFSVKVLKCRGSLTRILSASRWNIPGIAVLKEMFTWSDMKLSPASVMVNVLSSFLYELQKVYGIMHLRRGTKVVFLMWSLILNSSPSVICSGGADAVTERCREPYAPAAIDKKGRITRKTRRIEARGCL